MRRKNISFDFLKKQVKILTLFVTFCFSTYSLEFLSSNGENYFYYDNNKINFSLCVSLLLSFFYLSNHEQML